jgi:hypothetical protein
MTHCQRPHLGINLDVFAVHACTSVAEGVVGKAVAVELQALALLAVARAHVGTVGTAQHSRHCNQTQRVKFRALDKGISYRE